MPTVGLVSDVRAYTMYIPQHFQENRAQEIARIITQHPLGTLFTQGTYELDAMHLPFEYDAKADQAGVLRGHMARANPLWQQNHDGDAVLVVFQAENAYISPNWYPSKHEFHRQVPTWNYQVVHVHGILRIREDEKFLRAVVGRLTRDHDAHASAPHAPWRMSDASREYIDALLAAIVGVEVEVKRIEAVSKLSQNKEARDRDAVIQELEARGQTAIAETMRRAAPPSKS